MRKYPNLIGLRSGLVQVHESKFGRKNEWWATTHLQKASQLPALPSRFVTGLPELGHISTVAEL